MRRVTNLSICLAASFAVLALIPLLPPGTALANGGRALHHLPTPRHEELCRRSSGLLADHTALT